MIKAENKTVKDFPKPNQVVFVTKTVTFCNLNHRPSSLLL